MRIPLLRREERSLDRVRVRDLSQAGALLETASPLQMGERVWLDLARPGEENSALEGEVVRSQLPGEGEGSACFAAVRFLAGPPGSREALRSLLEAIRRRGVE